MLKEKSEKPSLEDILSEIGFGLFHLAVIFVIGITLLSDSMEILILAFIGPILTCSWQITLLDSTLITAGVFAGMIIGSILFGKYSDMYGRKPILIIGIIGIIYFGIASSVSPNLVWFIILRSFVGIFLGANTGVLGAYVTEVMPLKHRLVGMLSLEILWTFGPLIQTILVIVIIPRFGWNLWLFITVLPTILIIPGYIWLPESPRYLLVKGRVDEALKIINKIAIMNKKAIVSELKIPEPTQTSLCDVFHKNYRLTTVLMFFLWFLFGFSYYGFLQSATINNIPHPCLQDFRKISNLSLYSNVSVDDSCCFRLTWSNSQSILISSFGEIIICTITCVFGGYFKRKHVMFLLVFISMTVYFLINLCLSPLLLGFLLMLGRGSSSSLFGIFILYNSEVYPTSIRTFAMGFGSSFSKIGSIIAQIVFNFIMIQQSFLAGTILFSCLNLLGLICIVFLPHETKDKQLFQGIEQKR